jgi:membrane associated rhomboid family serine protease
VVLIAINVVVYLLAIRHGGSLIGGPSESVEARYGAIPYALTHPGAHCALYSSAIEGAATEVRCSEHGALPFAEGSELLPAWQTVFTSMFMHAGIIHLGGNMLFLAIFGPNVEDAMGRLRFVAFYLIGGLLALGLQLVSDPSSTAPTLGASGAIAAVLGGYIVLYPRARILTLVFIIFFVTIIELPAFVLLGFWFLLQVLESQIRSAANGGGVAHFAHIGGFLFGLAAIHLFATRRKAVPPRYPVY